MDTCIIKHHGQSQLHHHFCLFYIYHTNPRVIIVAKYTGDELKQNIFFLKELLTKKINLSQIKLFCPCSVFFLLNGTLQSNKSIKLIRL